MQKGEFSAALVLDELALSLLVEDAASAKGTLDDVGVMVELVISATLSTDVKDSSSLFEILLSLTGS